MGVYLIFGGLDSNSYELVEQLYEVCMAWHLLHEKPRQGML